MNRPRRRPLGARLYARSASLLLPRSVRRPDQQDLALTFGDLYARETAALGRARTLLRCLVALFQVALLERFDPSAPPPRRAKNDRHASNRHKAKPPEPLMQRWIHDLRAALRTLVRTPKFTLGSVALLALGVGAVTGIFTLFDNILLRPLPYPEPDRLVVIEDGSHTGPFWRGIQELDAAERWAAVWTQSQNWTGDGDPRSLDVGKVSEDFFRLIGARAQQGRLLAPSDYEAEDRIVLSHSLWLDGFGGDPEVVGRVIRIDGQPVEIVGIMEASFSPPEAITGSSVDLWRPMAIRGEDFEQHGYHVLQIAGRLKPDATVEQLTAQVQGVVEQLNTESDGHYEDREGNLWQVPISAMADVTVQGVRTGLRLLLAAVGLLLLIACTNVAHLSVARGLARVQEMSLRQALGASTGALIRQLLTESLVIAGLGGLFGIGLAAASVRVFLALNPDALPRGETLALDGRVIAFAALLSMLTVIVFGLLPAIQTARGARGGFGRRSQSEERGTSMLRSSLVVVEVALSLVLLIGAGILLRSFSAVIQQDTGVVAENVWRIPLSPTEHETPDQYVAEMERIRTALAAVPGVESVAQGLTLPFTFVGGNHCCWRTSVEVEGNDAERLFASMHPVNEDYWTTLSIPFLLGAPWSRVETSRDPMPVVLTASTAATFFGSPEEALGATYTNRSGSTTYEVYGVVADSRHYGLDQELTEMAYLPIERVPFPISMANFAVRTTGAAPDFFATDLRNAIWSVTPNLPIPTVEPFVDRIDESTAARRFDSVLFGTFGVVALLLAGAGLYGTLVYNVGRRRREMGIRMALGAARKTVEAQILGSGVRVVVVGIALGLIGAWATTRFLESRVWGVDTTDPTAVIGATVILLIVASLASWLPARRAGRIDPVETLRAE